MAVTSLSVKGQIVIPKAPREALGLRPGDKFIVLVEGDKIVLKPIKGNIAERLYGRYKGLDLLADIEEEHQSEFRRDLQCR